MTPDQQAREIASGLSPMDREALLNAKCGAPESDPEWTAECICGSSDAACSLVALGLARRRERFPHGIIRTPLGEQVKRLLLEEQQHG